MDPEYGIYGPDANFVAPYEPQLPLLMPPPQHLHEMQPPLQQHYVLNGHLSDYRQRNGCAVAAANQYMTAVDGRGASTSGQGDSDSVSVSSRRRRKHSNSDDDTAEDSRSVRTATDGKKQNHSEIEKRRRDKMNTYITELSSMIPMCGAISRKLDKLTVLRMAVQHLKSVRGAAHAYPEGRFKPEFLSGRELKMLILQAADGFLFVADCDRGRLLYVSESVNKSLYYSQSELLGQSLFDILHPKDVAKVKEQLSSPDLSPRERLIDAKTMLPVRADIVSGSSRLCSGARRSFFCRMKVKPGAVRRERDRAPLDQEHEATSRQHVTIDRKYCVVQCTGYLRASSSSELGVASARESSNCDQEDVSSVGGISCLVAIGRTIQELPRRVPERPASRRMQFVSRHTPDGKFTYVDQRVTPAVGYLPQEIHGTSLYEYVAPAQVGELARSHKVALATRTHQSTSPYAFRCKDHTWATVQTEWRPFRNPWTKELESLVAKNTIMELYADPPMSIAERHSGYFPQDDQEVQQAINSQLESHKIGAAIADEVLHHGHSSAATTPELAKDVQQEVSQYTQQQQQQQEQQQQQQEQQQEQQQQEEQQQQQQVDHSENSTLPDSALLPLFAQVRNNVVLSDGALPDNEDMLPMLTARGPPTPEPQPTDQPQPDGNDEATMSVIMSLLEADAGLGGPVDFSGLPWPLP